MSVVLKFMNPNSMDRTMIRLYRADYGTNIPDEPTDEPVLEGDGYTTMFVDDTVLAGQQYNYRFVVYIPGGDSSTGAQFTVRAPTLYGPGNQDRPDYGNESLWWFPNEYAGLMPSQADLMAISGAVTGDFIAWDDTWHKVSIGGEIYFIPHKGYIRITDTDKLWQYYAGNNMAFDKAGYSYTFNQGLDQNTSAIVLDAWLHKYNAYNPDYPKNNMVTAIAELESVDPTTTLVIYGKLQSNGNVLTIRAPGAGYTRAATFYDVASKPNAANWYWKPIIKLVPQTGGDV